MDSSQYDSNTRKDIKRFQRSAAYQAMKKEHLAKQARLLETIASLKKKLVEAGVAADDVAKLAT